MYWYSRIWQFAIIPLSIFASVAIINLLKRKRIAFKVRYTTVRNFLKTSVYSIILFFTLSNLIIAGIEYSQFRDMLNDEEAQITGWISENIPHQSNFLVDGGHFYSLLDDLTANKAYRIDYEFESAFANYVSLDYKLNADLNCSIYPSRKNFDWRIVEFRDFNPKGNISLRLFFNYGRTHGSIGFGLKFSNVSKPFFFSVGREKCISLMINASYVSILNSSRYQAIYWIQDGRWYDFNLDFECSISNHTGLDQHEWRLGVNGTQIGIFNFIEEIDYIDKVTMSTSILYSGYKIFFENLSLSWNLSFSILHCLFKFTKLATHLREKNINYFIYSSDDKILRTIIDEIYEARQDLRTYEYNTTLYEYEYLTICV